MAISEDNTRVFITMPKRLRGKLEEEAQEAKRSLSNYIVFLLEQRKTEEHGEGDI